MKRRSVRRIARMVAEENARRAWHTLMHKSDNRTLAWSPQCGGVLLLEGLNAATQSER